MSNSKLLSANHRGRRASLQSKQFLAPGKATYQERQQSCWRFPWICKNLSRLHWLVYQESGCDSHQKVSNRCQGCSEKSSRPVYQLFDSETMKGWKLHLFFVSAFLVLPLKRAVWVFLWKNVQNLKSIFIFAANVWFCSSVAFWCKQKGSICATRHLLFSTSPSPSPFPFPILELKISRFRILNSFRPYLTIMKGEEEVGIS